MAVSLENVVKQLGDSGIVAPGKLENFVPPKAHPNSVEELIAELVKNNHLTKFQATQVAAGKAKSLILGGYTILDRIGAGGMGQVFKALHRRMDRTVAIKMLPNAMMKDAPAVARFEREVRAAAKLEHPNIVTAHDADQANGVHFLVMQYVEGQDLSALVKKNGPFPVAKAVNYILQAARGLEFAHSEGVIHRDIKPANLLLDKKGTVKILDMGLARIESEGNVAAQAELTGTGAVMGTVDYMAPEQGVSTKNADARADIYSLGCSLYYLIAGKATYSGETVMAKMLAHHHDAIPNLRELNGEVPEQVQTIFHKMVAKTVEDRYQSMSEVIADLERCSSGSQTSLGTQQSASTNLENSALTFLKDMPVLTTQRTKATKKVAAPKSNGEKQPPWKNTKVLIGAAFVGVLILAGIIISLQTKDGTLIVEVDQPDAMVQVLDAEGKVEVSQKGGGGKVTISVDPGKHRLRVEKEGFTIFGQEFEIESGGEKAITAKLVPVKAAVVVQPNKPWNTPAFQAWVKDLQVLPADKQADAVFLKLLEVNPRLDPKSRPGREIKDDAVIEWRFSSANNLVNLSPVRALSQMKSLVLSSCPELEDLLPLEGMSLTSLHLHGSKVKNFSPLKGMPLTTLTVSFVPVTDLSPLEGMRLQQLYIHACNVNDLSVLQGMPLTELHIGALSIKDLASLRGLPLQKLTFSGGLFSDLTPLKDMPLIEFHCGNIRVTDLTPLYSCKDLRLATFKGNRFTAAAITSLQKALPNCKIEWDDPTKPSTPPAPTGPAPPLAKAPFDAAQAKAHQEAWAKHLGTEVETTNSVGMKMVLIPPGEFMMGSMDEQATKDRIQKAERPQHRVVITKPLLMGATEVTVGHFKQFSATGYKTEAEKAAESKTWLKPGYEVTDDSPVACITWNDAVAYCKWLSDQENATYRLPTEAEWEYACRAGTTTQYSFGDDLGELPKYGWHNQDRKLGRSYPVGTLLANPFGLFDMHGNLYESCHDSYSESWYEKSPTNDPNGPSTGSSRVIRGGGWHSIASETRSAFRYSPPANRYSDLGFRIVRDFDAPSTLASITAQSTVPAAAPAKPITDFNSPEFQAWMKEVQAMPAEEQVKAVSKKLVELNPGFDGKVTGADGKGTPKIENGVVTELGFITDNVTSISPVRALAGLKTLNCSGSGRNYQRNKFADISPLQGMALTSLFFDHTNVSELSPLVGMPLLTLEFYSTGVSSLAPLRGMSLTRLACGGNGVSDLSPLTGMPLSVLLCNHTQVADLSAIKGMPLATLWCHNTQVSDLSLLAECKSLKGFSAHHTRVTAAQIAELQKALPNCKIDWYEANPSQPSQTPAAVPAASPAKPITDFNSPEFQAWVKGVQAMPAEEQVKAVSKKLMELNPGFDGKIGGRLGQSAPKMENGVVTEIAFRSDRVSDLSPVRALPGLSALHITGNTGLKVEESALRDLSPLKGMPLKHIYIGRTGVTDLSPLHECPLLNHVSTRGSVIPPASVAALQKALPICKIDLDDPAKPTTPQPAASGTK